MSTTVFSYKWYFLLANKLVITTRQITNAYSRVKNTHMLIQELNFKFFESKYNYQLVVRYFHKF